MGTSYFASASERKAYHLKMQLLHDQETNRIADERRKIAAKIVMAIVDKIVNEIIRPGPSPEERECYEMAGETRALISDLEILTKKIIDVNDGVE